ncbi:MAG: hypothetical protein K0Q49_290, partial [Haloplasmataceae bacterium]|nr:hypothetical protein [Haloplasmataceae bacterium]
MFSYNLDFYQLMRYTLNIKKCEVKIMIESKRLILRKITHNDFNELASMLKDIEVMNAWEHTFS